MTQTEGRNLPSREGWQHDTGYPLHLPERECPGHRSGYWSHRYGGCRPGGWSTQKQNFIPILFAVVVLGVVFLIVGLSVGGVFGFSGLSILIFVWLFFTWLFLFGLAALPIFLAIVVWVVEGSQWLWPRYRGRFWWAIPIVGGRLTSTSSRLSDRIGTQADRLGKYTKIGKQDKKKDEHKPIYINSGDVG